MTTSAATQSSPIRATDTLAIMLYSDNASIRREVRLAVGEYLGERAQPIEWTEVATPTRAMQLAEEVQFDLVIGDNDTGKLGGVGLVRQLRNELAWQPKVALLLARQQDAWLAAWCGADAAIVQPADPFALRAKVAGLLGLASE